MLQEIKTNERQRKERKVSVRSKRKKKVKGRKVQEFEDN